VNLGQLLDELRHGMLHDRSDQIAGDASDYLWSDKRLTEYINQSERKFAREGLVIRDGSTPEVCILQTIPFQQEYTLHPSVVAVISAKGEHDRADLARAGHSQFQTYRTVDTYWFNPSELSTVPPGKILAFGTDEELQRNDEGSTQVVTFRAFPKPDPLHACKIHLRVIRKPLYPLVKKEDVPEIPDDHHLDMLDWAAYLALRIVDHDIGDPQRAADFAATFKVNVDLAKREAMRKMFSPAAWGFGRSGFSWERDYQ
jgi:hypothetical protein